MSLRARLILTNTLIVIFCLSIVALAVSVIIQGYRDRIAETRLDDITRPIYVQIRALVKAQASADEVWANLQEQAQKNEIYVLVVNSDGNIIRQAAPQPGQAAISVPSGEIPHNIAQPTSGTFRNSSGERFLCVAYPLGKLFETALKARPETLVLALPRGGALTMLSLLIRPLLWGGLAALGVSVTIAFFLARSIYHPVRRVTEAAEKMGEGQYDQAVPVTGPKEIKALALRFNEMAGKVKQSQEQLRYFVADVSHQLKSPLTSIQGFAQAINDGTAADSETRQKAAKIIEDESRRMIRQVDELLELARMQAGQARLISESVDIEELLSHCYEIFTLRAEEKGINFTMEIGQLPTVVGDIDRLEQVFCNLLDNAMKNSLVKGEVQITGRCAGTDAIEVTITDDGPGIPPEQLPYIFQRFHQAAGLRTGFGLGLAIAKEIIASHGGKIAASSSPGEKTKFTVTLPLLKRQEPPPS